MIGVGVVAAGLDTERAFVGVRVSIVDSVFANMLSVVNRSSRWLCGYRCDRRLIVMDVWALSGIAALRQTVTSRADILVVCAGMIAANIVVKSV